MRRIKQLKGSDVPHLRKKLLSKCNGICPICQTFNEAPVLDHSHVKKVGGSGLVRGVICRNCNVFLGKMENNCKRYGIQPADLPTVLRQVALYLERPHLLYRHPSEKPKEPILKVASYNKLRKLYNGRAKFPPYRKNAKGKPIQKMTVQLTKLFKEHNLEPEFYK